MSELRRLLDDDPDEFERALLGAAKAYEPPERLRQGALLAVGLSSTLAVSKFATAVTAVKSILLGKGWLPLAIWAGVTTGAATGIYVVSSARPAARSLPTESRGRGTDAGRGSSQAPGAEHSDGPDGVTDAPAAAVSAPAEAPAGDSAAARPAPSPARPRDEATEVRRGATRPNDAPPPEASTPREVGSLGDEMALLDAARGALRSHDATRSLSLLATHDQRYPRGALGLEAAVVRIEAYVALGDRATASRLGASFLAAYPNHVLSDRVRTLTGLAPREGGRP